MLCDKGIFDKLGVKGHRLCTLTFATSKTDIESMIESMIVQQRNGYDPSINLPINSNFVLNNYIKMFIGN